MTGEGVPPMYDAPVAGRFRRAIARFTDQHVVTASRITSTLFLAVAPWNLLVTLIENPASSNYGRQARSR